MRRTDQRRAAVWALYQSDLLGRPLGDTLPRDVHGFTFALAEQAREHQPELDELIGRYASGWTLARIAPLERSILRVALLELLYPDVIAGEEPIPPEAAINEAVETAKRFCGSSAPAFINGILGAVLRDRAAKPDGSGAQRAEPPRDRGGDRSMVALEPVIAVDAHHLSAQRARGPRHPEAVGAALHHQHRHIGAVEL